MNALLALSMTSSQAVMALLDESADRVLASREWNNLGGAELAQNLEKNLNDLLMDKGTHYLCPKIIKVFGVEGPGSFTGLRVSSAFLKGLATALAVPLVGISSYDLFHENFAFSLRPAKSALLNFEECIEREYKFLEVSANQVHVVVRPTCKKILGLKDTPFWPTVEELQKGVKRSLEKTTFNLNYGYTPEFVTQKGT